MSIDQEKLNRFLGAVVGDVGAAMSAALVVIGDRLGLYRGLAARGPSTAGELARQTGTCERYIQEWLDSQASGGYVEYSADTGRYSLSPEQAAVLADETSPAFVPGLFQITAAMWAGIERIGERFASGAGLAWGEHHDCLFEGTERFFRAGYIGNLVSAWLPALDGAVERLERGAKVADVGCGLGASTILMAQAFPRSRFFGFDSHPISIDRARQRAAEAGVADRVTFEVARATDFPGRDYDLIAHFDCLHDMEESDRRRAPRARGAGGRRPVDDRRAVRVGSARGEPQPGRPGLLLGVGDDLRAALAVAARPGARRAGRRVPPARGRRRGRLRPLPPRHRDAVQPCPRGAPLRRLSQKKLAL